MFRGRRVTVDGEATEDVVISRQKRKVQVARGRNDVHRNPLGGSKITTETVDSEKLAVERLAELVAEARAEGFTETFGGRSKRIHDQREKRAEPFAPVLWRVKTPQPAYAVFVDQDRCWTGNNEGLIHVFGHDGSHLHTYEVPDGVGCILRDELWTYVGCDNGNVYDISRDEAHLAYEVVHGEELLALAVHDGDLIVADRVGQVSVFDHESGKLWSVKSGDGDGWAVVCDDRGVVHGHEHGLTALDWRSNERWRKATEEGVTCGDRQGELFVFGNDGGCVGLYRPDGTRVARLVCDTAVTACCVADDGRTVYAGDHQGALYAFDADGTRRWVLSSGVGAAFALDVYGEKLFAAARRGEIYCVDVSEEAVRKALAGEVPEVRAVTVPRKKEARKRAKIETTRDAGNGVVLECVKEGSHLRVRVVSEGYDKTWNCQFPRDLREDGARFVVDAVVPARRGGFYRVKGAIRRLVVKKTATKKPAVKKTAVKKKPAAKKIVTKKKPARRKA